VFALKLHYLLRSDNFDWLHLRVTPFRPIVEVIARAKLPMSAEHFESSLPNPHLYRIRHKFSLILNNSEPSKAQLFRDLEITPERVIPNPDGIEPDLFSGPVDRQLVRSRFCLDADTFVIAHVSSFRWHHDFQTILQAVRSLGFPAQLAFCGAGSRTNEVKASAVALGVSAVFLGSLPEREIREVLGASDACVDALVRRSHTGIGNLQASKLWEYMASGTPTVETVDATLPLPPWAGGCLGLAPCENSAALAKVLNDIRYNQPVWVERAAKARDWVFTNKTWDIAARRTIEAMEATMADFRGPSTS
jgi:glycosyltransferase involved in cell wall biosynthesis